MMGAPDKHITDYDLQALVDGALDHDDHQSLIEVVKHNPRLWQRLEDLYYQKFIMKEWWRSLPVS